MIEESSAVTSWAAAAWEKALGTCGELEADERFDDLNESMR